MQAPFNPQRAFLYGRTFFDEEVPYYNSSRNHRKPAPRQFPDNRVYEDGALYQETPVADTEAGDGSMGYIRYGQGPLPTILNLESQIIKTLRITLYGLKEEDDKVIDMEIGKRYAITYMTESGCYSIDGYLRYISDSIPDECTRYSGNYSSQALQAFIGMDCSTKGVSDKRKVYLTSIRDIQVLEDDADYTPPIVAGSISDLLKAILARVNYLENCQCMPLVETIKNTVDEIQQFQNEHEEFQIDLDADGDGTISMQELGFDDNGNPIPEYGDDEAPSTDNPTEPGGTEPEIQDGDDPVDDDL